MTPAYLITCATLLILGRVLRSVSPSINQFAGLVGRFLILISLPALILVSLPGRRPGLDQLAVVLTPWLVAIMAITVAVAGYRRLGWSKDIAIAFTAMVTLGNTAFFGPGLIQQLFGPDTVAVAILFDQFGSFILVCLFSALLPILTASKVVAGNDDFNSKQLTIAVIGRIIRFPPFVALMLALVIEPIDSIPYLYTGLQWLASTTLPLALFVIGVYLQFTVAAGDRLALAILLVCKLVLYPLLAVFISQVLNLSEQSTQALIMQSAMPVMITAAIVLIDSKTVPRFTAAALSLSSLLSLLTIPFWAFVVL